MVIHHFGSWEGLHIEALFGRSDATWWLAEHRRRQHGEDSFGIFMLVQSEGADEKQNASRLTQHTGFAIIASASASASTNSPSASASAWSGFA
jgi:hypothetical protein